MKYHGTVLLTLALLPFIPGNALAASDTQMVTVTANHKITDVTVYRDRAMISRHATLPIPAGKSTITFTDLPDNLDLKSFRAGINTKEIELLGISWERIFTNSILNDKLNELEKQQKVVLEELECLTDRLFIVNHKRSLSANFETLLIRSVSEQSAVSTNRKDWNLDFKRLDQLYVTLNQESADLEIKIKTTDERLKKIKSELKKYSQPTQGSRITAIVAVKSEKAVDPVEVTLSYVTEKAGWKPKYDARVNPETGKIGFTYFGIITQNTSENWDQAKIKLSTAQPNISANPPAAPTLWLGGYPSVGNKVREVVTENKEIASQHAQMDQAVYAAAVMKKDDFSTIEDQGPSISFMVNGKQTIPTGNQPGIVTLAADQYQGVLSYECIPSIRQYVYLKAKFKNSSRYPILKGSASIYRLSGFIGNTEIDFSAIDAETAFFAGIQDGISVVRGEICKKETSHGLISKVSNQYTGYGITFLNSTAKPVTIALKESIPVSQVDEIKVKLVDKEILGASPSETIPATTQGYTLNEKTGLISWNVTLNPGEKKTVKLVWCVGKEI